MGLKVKQLAAEESGVWACRLISVLEMQWVFSSLNPVTKVTVCEQSCLPVNQKAGLKISPGSYSYILALQDGKKTPFFALKWLFSCVAHTGIILKMSRQNTQSAGYTASATKK